MIRSANSSNSSLRYEWHCQIGDATYYKWRKQYGQMKLDQVKRLKELERENSRLKKLVAELSLDKAILKEALSGHPKGPRSEITAPGKEAKGRGTRTTSEYGEPVESDRDFRAPGM